MRRVNPSGDEFELFTGYSTSKKVIGHFRSLAAAKSKASEYPGHPHSWSKSEFHKAEGGPWTQEWTGGPGNKFTIQKAGPAKNPAPRTFRNPGRLNPIMTIQGHTVSRTSGDYRVDAYGKTFTTKSACRTWLKGHVAAEKRQLRSCHG